METEDRKEHSPKVTEIQCKGYTTSSQYQDNKVPDCTIIIHFSAKPKPNHMSKQLRKTCFSLMSKPLVLGGNLDLFLHKWNSVMDLTKGY